MEVVERGLEVGEDLGFHSLLLRGGPGVCVGGRSFCFYLSGELLPHSFNVSYHFRKHKHSWKINSLKVGEDIFITQVNSSLNGCWVSGI